MPETEAVVPELAVSMVLGGMFVADEVETPEPAVVPDSDEPVVESGGVALLSLPTPFWLLLLLSKEGMLGAGKAANMRSSDRRYIDESGSSISMCLILASISSMSGTLYCHRSP